MMTVPYSTLNPRQRRRLLWRVVLRSTATVGLLTAIYYLAPLDRAPEGVTALSLALVSLTFVGVAVWQFRAIVRAPYPRLRAVEALATLLPLLLLAFSITYVLMERAGPGSFSEALSRTDALYFTVTVFSTTGFGDIVPVAEAARLVTMAQMLFDVVALGAIAKVLLGAVEIGLRRRPGQAGAENRKPPGPPPGGGRDRP